MTEIADLIEKPQARLAFLMQDFVDHLREKHRKEEAMLDEIYEANRTRLHRLHMKTQSAYKSMFDEMLIKLNRDEDVEILEWFEFILRTQRKDLVAEVLERTKPVIREIELQGGTMEFDIRKGGYGMSGCIYSERKGGYFSFLDEFLDGFDDDVVFSVKRTTKSEKEREKERDARLQGHVDRWRAEERAKRVTAEEALAAVEADGTSLREVPLEEACVNE